MWSGSQMRVIRPRAPLRYFGFLSMPIVWKLKIYVQTRIMLYFNSKYLVYLSQKGIPCGHKGIPDGGIWHDHVVCLCIYLGCDSSRYMSWMTAHLCDIVSAHHYSGQTHSTHVLANMPLTVSKDTMSVGISFVDRSWQAQLKLTPQVMGSLQMWTEDILAARPFVINRTSLIPAFLIKA